MATAPLRRAPAAAPAAVAPTRSGPPPRTPARAVAAAAPPSRQSGFTGAAGLAKAQQEAEDQLARQAAAKLNAGAPFRFWMPPNSTREFCIIDESPFYFRQEHALLNKATGKNTNFVECIKDFEDCPACETSDRPSYYGLYLTVIDLTPYTNDKGHTTEFSKKILLAKTRQQQLIINLYNRHKSLRGMVIETTRLDDKDASIGSSFSFVEFLDEDTLAQYQYDYDSGQGRDKKTVHVDCSQVYDYPAIFPPTTVRQLEVAAGSRKSIGNREADRAELAAPATRRNPQAAQTQDTWDDPAPAAAPARRAAPAPVAEPIAEAVDAAADDLTWMEEFDYANDAGEYCNEQGEYPPQGWMDPDERAAHLAEVEAAAEPAPAPAPAVRRAVDPSPSPARRAAPAPVEHTPEDETPPWDGETAEEVTEAAPPPTRRVATAAPARGPAPAARRAPAAAAPAIPARRAAPAAEPVQEDAPPPRRAAGRAMAGGR